MSRLAAAAFIIERPSAEAGKHNQLIQSRGWFRKTGQIIRQKLGNTRKSQWLKWRRAT